MLTLYFLAIATGKLTTIIIVIRMQENTNNKTSVYVRGTYYNDYCFTHAREY